MNPSPKSLEPTPAYQAHASLHPPVRPFLRVTGPQDIYNAVPALTRKRFEEFHVFLLNARHEATRRVMVSRGSLNAAIVHPREVFRPAIIASAAAIILVHNHPSGDPEPSSEDISVTRIMAQVGEVHGIHVLDHIIVVRGGFVSMKSRGLV